MNKACNRCPANLLKLQGFIPVLGTLTQFDTALKDLKPTAARSSNALTVNPSNSRRCGASELRRPSGRKAKAGTGSPLRADHRASCGTSPGLEGVDPACVRRRGCRTLISFLAKNVDPRRDPFACHFDATVLTVVPYECSATWVGKILLTVVVVDATGQHPPRMVAEGTTKLVQGVLQCGPRPSQERDRPAGQDTMKWRRPT